jgi:hypothetical protein
VSTALPDPATGAAWTAELTEQERCALPAAYHRPYFDGLAKPNAWICAVCWGDGWTQLWPCFTARENGVELAKSLGVGWSW